MTLAHFFRHAANPLRRAIDRRQRDETALPRDSGRKLRRRPEPSRLVGNLFPDLEQHHPGATLYGIGTILGGEHDASALKVVLGSGLGYRSTPKLDDTWDIRWVRGPLFGAAARLVAGQSTRRRRAVVVRVGDRGDQLAGRARGPDSTSCDLGKLRLALRCGTVRPVGHRPEALTRRRRRANASLLAHPHRIPARRNLRGRHGYSVGGLRALASLQRIQVERLVGRHRTAVRGVRSRPTTGQRLSNAARHCPTGWPVGRDLEAGQGVTNCVP